VSRSKTTLPPDSEFHRVVARLAPGARTMSDTVYNIVREAILSGALAPGEWLRQETLAEAIGVSRVPVRNALIRLDSEGLLTLHPRRGARVRPLSVARIDEVCRLRIMCERHALKLSMPRMTPERLAELGDLADTLDESVEHRPELVGIRDRFYRGLYDYENSPVLVETIEVYRRQYSQQWPHVHAAGDRRHLYRELVHSVAEGDIGAAEAWVSAYVTDARAHQRAMARARTEPDEDGRTPRGA